MIYIHRSLQNSIINKPNPKLGKLMDLMINWKMNLIYYFRSA